MRWITGPTGCEHTAVNTALVTGSAGGIGSATIRALEGAGFAVHGLDVDDDAEAVFGGLDRLDALVCAHGISGRRLGDGPVDTCTEEAWDAVLDANLRSVFLYCRRAVPLLRAAGGGAIVTVSSALALVGGDEDFATHAYAASKAGLVGLTRAMAVTYAREGIRCNVVCPGLIATPMSRRAQDDSRIRAAGGCRAGGRLPRHRAVRDGRGAHRRRRLDGTVTRRVGLDVGGTNIKLVVLEGDEVVERGSEPTRSEDGPDQVLRRIAALARDVGHAQSVGVAFPGLFDGQGRGILFPNLHGDWGGRPIAAPLAEFLGTPVSLVNDGHAFALAEARVGAARGARNVVCIVCGTGVGGGLVLDGRLHLGVENRAGEVGHHTVVLDGPECPCGNRGCLELFAGARAIARAGGQATFDAVVEAAHASEPASVEALRRAGELIGVAVANLTIFVAPERVVIGGGVAAAGDLLLAPLRAEVERRAGNVAPLEQIEIVPATLGPLAGAVGAALFAADAAVAR
jgi:glucokinase